MDHSKRVAEFAQDNQVAVSKSIEKILDDSQHTGELLLNGKKLTDLPASIINYDLSDLSVVDLSRNSLSDLPCFLFNFLSLEHLDCKHNLIRSIPPSISTFKHLIVLDLSHNQLTAFPQHACHFQCLQVLNLSNNKIKSLPQDVGMLHGLMELNLSKNLLTELPNSLEQLHSLKHLSVHHNWLTSLNPAITSLHLEKLDISVNAITRIPLELHRMTTLDYLDINNNPLISPPQHVIVKGRQHIMAYLASEHHHQERMKLRRQEIPRVYMKKNGLSSSTIVFRSYSQDNHHFNKQTSDSGCDRIGNVSKISNKDIRSIHDNSDKRNSSKENKTMSSCLSVDALLGLKKKQDGGWDGYGSDVVGYDSDVEIFGHELESPRSSTINSTSTETLNFNESPLNSPSSLNEDVTSDKLKAKTFDEKEIKSNGEQRSLVDIGFIVDEENYEDNQMMSSTKLSEDDEENGQPEFYKRYSNFVNHRKQEAAKIMRILNEEQVPSECKKSVLSPKCKQMLEAMEDELSEHNPLLTIRRNMHQFAQEKTQTKRLQKILRAFLKMDFDENAVDSLKDGVVLCQLANQIVPNSVPDIYTSTQNNKLSEAKSRKNVENFLNVCKRVGLKQEDVFMWQNLLEVDSHGWMSDDVSYSRKLLKITVDASETEPLIQSSSLQDHLIAMFCIFFFFSTCLYLYNCPLPS